MRHCRIALLALALAVLCAGCVRQGTAQQEPEKPAVPTETFIAEQKNEDTSRQAALRAYLDVLAENREAILGYDWQKGMVYSEEYYETLPAGVTEGVAIVDVWGDETPELIYLTAKEDNGLRYEAVLHVCAWDGGAVRELRGEDMLDWQVGGGMLYRLFQTQDDKSLWLYSIEYHEGYDETYTRFTTEGAMTPAFTCKHSLFPLEVENGNGEWETEETWERMDTPCSEAEYQASVPAEAVQAQGLIMRNAEYYEYGGEQPPEGTFRYPQGSALSCDAAVDYLRAELGVEPEAMDAAALFAAMPDYFYFASGVGAWSTDLTIAEDGTFTGSYHDSDMGDDGEDYPNGTIYVSSFSGRFGNVTRVDDYTYSMHLLEMQIDPTPAEEWIEDGVRYVASLPYGLENADEVMVYLPGAWIQSLPMEFVTWVAMPRAWGDDERPVLLPCWGLYNVAGQEGFSGDEAVG